jgi:hypothetical protein
MLGLVSAANRYDPRVGAFAPFAYWRIRGEMVDSQKRRAFREAQHLSLDAIAAANDGWLPPEIDCRVSDSARSSLNWGGEES